MQLAAAAAAMRLRPQLARWMAPTLVLNRPLLPHCITLLLRPPLMIMSMLVISTLLLAMNSTVMASVATLDQQQRLLNRTCARTTMSHVTLPLTRPSLDNYNNDTHVGIVGLLQSRLFVTTH